LSEGRSAPAAGVAARPAELVDLLASPLMGMDVLKRRLRLARLRAGTAIALAGVFTYSQVKRLQKKPAAA